MPVIVTFISVSVTGVTGLGWFSCVWLFFVVLVLVTSSFFILVIFFLDCFYFCLFVLWIQKSPVLSSMAAKPRFAHLSQT